MKKAFWLLVGITTLAVTARAWLGNTRDECDRRFGNPEKVDTSHFVPKGEQRIYRKDDWVFTVEWMGTNTGAAMISVVHQPLGRQPLELTEDEKKILCNANAQGQKWVLTAMTIDGETWVRTDKKAIGQYLAKARSFVFYTTEAVTARNDYLKVHKRW